MALLPSELSDEYCFSSLCPVSSKSSDYLFYVRNDSNTRHVYRVPGIIVSSLSDVSLAVMFRRNWKLRL